MDFIDLKLVPGIISIILFGIGFPFMLSKWKVSNIQLTSTNLEFYEKLKSLCGTNANYNLPTLLVAIHDYAACELKPEEIEWFIHVPGAFKFLKRYGKYKKYIEINKNPNSIKLSIKYSSKRKRVKERIKIIIFYGLTGIIGGFGFLSTPMINSNFGTVSAIVCLGASILLIILALFLLLELTKIDDAVRLVNEKIYKET